MNAEWNNNNINGCNNNNNNAIKKYSNNNYIFCLNDTLLPGRTTREDRFCLEFKIKENFYNKSIY